MKDTEIIFLVEESNEGGYEARALEYSIYTEGEDIEELRKNVLDSVRCHFDANDCPSTVLLYYQKEEILTL